MVPAAQGEMPGRTQVAEEEAVQRHLSAAPAATARAAPPHSQTRTLRRGGGRAVMAARSISASHWALMPGTRPAAITATTRDALRRAPAAHRSPATPTRITICFS